MASTIELKTYRTERGCRTALVRINGPKWMHVLVMTAPLTIRKVSKTEERFMSELTDKHGMPYPLKKAIRHFRHFGKASGITKPARTFLNNATQ